MKRFVLIVLFCLASLLQARPVPSQRAPALETMSPDERFLLAHKAVHAGDHAEFERIAQSLKGHDLSAYIDYWRARIGFGTAGREAMQAFMERHPAGFLAEQIPADWLKFLGSRHRWQEFITDYPLLAHPDQEVLCYAIQASGRQRGLSAALDEATPLWLNLVDPPDACLPLLESLVVGKRVRAEDVWARIRRQFEARKMKAARHTLRYLPQSQAPDEKTVRAVTEKPLPWLKNLPENFQENPMLRELAILAISRLAWSDVPAALEQLKRIESKLKSGEKEWIWGQMAGWAAQRHMPDALLWFGKTGKMPLSDHLIQWKARAALRRQNWSALREVILKMPKELAEQRVWTYWLGRACYAEGNTAEAWGLFGKIAGKPDFYGNLADEELGRAVTLPPKTAAPTPGEMARASSNPAMLRSLALIRVGLRFEGVREWNWAMRGMNDRELLAASEFARSRGVFDRAISAAERTKSEHDYTLRYLIPFDEQIRPAAQKLNLDDAWVYGLMRQESRFIVDAKSVVGASGLMQLMPKTARWVARKIGLKDYQPSRIADTETNVLLGTSYMRMVLDKLDDHPVLASAAYNAGPSRARKWQPGEPLEGAIYVETIPFNETRDYVQKVMSNTLYYSMLFGQAPQTLKKRLGVIQPPSENEPKSEELP